MSNVVTPHESVRTGGPAVVRPLDVALLAGLAGVFIANALVALLQPDDFVDLVRLSVLADRVPIRPGHWLTVAIFVNDLALGLLLLTSIRLRHWRPVVLAWSGVWLLAVTVIKLTSLDVFVA